MACILIVPWLGIEVSISTKTYIVNVCFRNMIMKSGFDGLASFLSNCTLLKAEASEFLKGVRPLLMRRRATDQA